MKRKKPPLHGNVVKTMMIGNTTVSFCDDCFLQTQEEIDQALDEFCNIGKRVIEDLIANGQWDVEQLA